MANVDNQSEPLLTLAEYLELSLDEGGLVILARTSEQSFTVYIGDMMDSLGDMRTRGNIAAATALAILEQTSPGWNQIVVGGQTYRFMRTYAQLEEIPATVFTPI
ncbi:hypothetical protein FAZ95_03140 [Trinickia violacea]|uniref:Uncharacterized protein n=1 Tax=Trinickia violacea TaxID=2571746 RepID=A0A4P8IHU1_9BURK|nr:hypothetical protein [Trinickia violacea]QCP48272.1 hypothetical protein FAZ95_03140 [Trinickia violacea]